MMNFVISQLVVSTGCKKQQFDIKPNILFIAVDDLRPELGCYGKNHIVSPNIDNLASNGVIFNRAYCNMPVCGASRASLMTGIYPNRYRFRSFDSRADKDALGVITLPSHFKNNGYDTFSFGKVFHDPDDDLQGWTESWRATHPNDIHKQEFSARDYQSPEHQWRNQAFKSGPAWEKADVAKNVYLDGKTAEKTIAKLYELSKYKKPFFLAMGLTKPHLPFNAPSKFWELYSRQEIELAPNSFFPQNAPIESVKYNYDELRAYINIPAGTEPIHDDTAQWLKHGYFACITYVDELIGDVLKTLKETGLDKNTVIVLWGDNGYSLGEHTHWCKHTCFHNSLQVPLIIKAPGTKPAKTNALVSLVDVYPTLCELAGLPMPLHLQGNSLTEILENPKKKTGMVFCRFPNGETVVTQKYVYTEYYNYMGDELQSRMLYDIELDPLENVNIVDDLAYSSIVEELSKKLKEHIKYIN